MVHKIDHVNIVVTNLAAARDFFLELGFRETMQSDLDGDFLGKVTGLKNIRARFIALALPGTETALELIEYRSPQSDADPFVSDAHRPGIRHIAFAVTDIEALVSKLRQSGVKFESEIQVWEKTGKKLVYFYGPEGILLEFAEYPKQ